MNAINRSALVVRPKEPFIRWVLSNEANSDPESERYARARIGIYLVPEDPSGRRRRA